MTALIFRCFLLLLCLSPMFATAADRPNVIVFIADDVSWNDYGCYGNAAARTPNIDALAESGIRFDAAYLTASSCSPSRSSIITGRYPHNNGKAAELHQPIAGHLPWFPEVLNKAGYYTALSGKHHMSSTAPKQGTRSRPVAFDSVTSGRSKQNTGGHADWLQVTQQRPKDQPFFFWFAAYDAHRGWDADGQWDEKRFGPKHRPEDVLLPPFLSNDPQTRRDLASYYNEVTRFDWYIGQVLRELKSQQVFDDTLIFVLADNGRPFPRAKTRLHDSGMKTALVAHWTNGLQHSNATNSLVSVIDLAPTILQAAGCEIPATFQGVPLQPIFEKPDAKVRRYAFSEHNWHDYEAHGRSVRNGNYLLIKNFRPYLPWQGPADSVRSPSHKNLLKLKAADQLDAAQQDVFLTPRPATELYDTKADPHQLRNLAGQTQVADVQQQLQTVLTEWMDVTGDSVPNAISPDTFDRVTGDRLPKDQVDRTGVLTPGQDRKAERINAAGPH